MELRVSEPADIAKHSNGYEQREREKPPEDKGVYRFLGRKDCIFSSPFSNNTGSNNFAVALTPPLLFHSPTPPPSGLHTIRIIIIRHDQVYAISRRYLREMTIYCVFSWKCFSTSTGWNFVINYRRDYLFFLFTFLTNFFYSLLLSISEN